jgi:DNA repair exonuclease SbcCD ATPase subunit/DNA repair exonuclease SbcCD nuclease subunit
MNDLKYKNDIAHLSDLHIRFGSRHEEHETVFKRVREDLEKHKPRRIVIAGDLFHVKINISPKSLRIVGNLLRELSEIAPVDVIIGNHDLNLQSLEQGDSISPIIELVENGYILTEKDADKRIPSPRSGNGVYLYRDTGFYEVDDEIIYGVFSCLDGRMLELLEKKKGKKYIALFHGPLYGCRSDSGYEMKGDELMRLSRFNNFDAVMLGDIHEYQSFERDNGNTCAYAGSILQNNYGESIDKGYLMWNLSDFSHTRMHIPNDNGFAKLNIFKGEVWEDRVNDIKFSLNKKKTKVWVELEDDEENYSVEKLHQIERFIRDRFGCETVNVDFKPIRREYIYEGLDNTDRTTEEVNNDYEMMLKTFLQNNDYDNVDDVIQLSKEIDNKLSLVSENQGRKWELNRFEVFNLFSFPAEVTSFDFNRLNGVTGIFGNNYCGKSNIIRALVWALYQKMLDEGETNRLPNMYTGVNNAWTKVFLTIDGVKYIIHRSVKVRIKKDGTPEVSYDVSYQYENYVQQPDGSTVAEWKDAESEKAASEKTEKKRMISEALGTFEDFTKVSLQSQSGKDGYLSLAQQPKNDLINKFLGLELYRDRYDEANETFKKVKAVQKVLGDPSEMEKSISANTASITTEKTTLEGLTKEKNDNLSKIDGFIKEIVDLTKQLTKLENLTETNPSVIEKKIKDNELLVETDKKDALALEQWLSVNFKKEIQSSVIGLDLKKLERELAFEKEKFSSEKDTYVGLDAWLKANPKKPETDTTKIQEEIDNINVALNKLSDKLKLAKGEKCPTCGHVKHEHNKEIEKDCIEKIGRGKVLLSEKQAVIKEQRSIVAHNNNFDKETNRLDAIKNSLQSKKASIDKIKADVEDCAKKDETVLHNNQVESKAKSLDFLKKSIDAKEKAVEVYREQLRIIEKNKKAIEDNAAIEKKISRADDDSRTYKTINLQLDGKIKESSGNIRVHQNNVENFTEKLNAIRDADRTYKKYSVFLQAVGRDGIPARIIKNKLPLINHRINSVLKGLVNFKIEMHIKSNGDIRESFFYSDKKSDTLPLSMASGAQRFLGSLAIREALHSVSCLTKPSMCIIDEGFGTLDTEKTSDIYLVFSYLKNKYKNVIIITHKNEIKDFVDNNIYVTKTKAGIGNEVLEENPEAGISCFAV